MKFLVVFKLIEFDPTGFAGHDDIFERMVDHYGYGWILEKD